MKKYLLPLCLLACACTRAARPVAASPELTDDDPRTVYTGQPGLNRIAFDAPDPAVPVASYRIVSGDGAPHSDPVEWTLKGSADGRRWTVVDQRHEQRFASRYQEVLCSVQHPGAYTQYMLEIAAADGDTLRVADVGLYTQDRLAGWQNFRYPEVVFTDDSPQTEGSRLYRELVQDPDRYVKYHARKVAEILFYSDADSMNDVRRIDYRLHDYDGISSKGGAPPVVAIQYSTRHVERSAEESLWKMDYETRGVLYHELVHAYQFEPKNIGSYSTNREFWACIEGLADAVRAEAGFFDVDSLRRPGGHWLDGYRTTGFFLQWLTTLDPDALRRFHETVRDLPTWSFDEAMRTMFGADRGIDRMWAEYQAAIADAR